MELQQAIAHCQQSILNGSKSFSLAARLFDRETRDAAFCLYGWCRYCDDQIDASTEQNKLARWAALRSETEACYEGKKTEDPVFVAFQYVTSRYRIPKEYAFDLLEGMAMDVRGDRYETFEELKRYCYCVAGTVGLMMACIMRVEDKRAYQNACDLGIAMQLTNIARDIREDAGMGRLYLPMAWLKETGLKEEKLMYPSSRSQLVFLVKRLLKEADHFYLSGDAGLKFLPLRMAIAISSARHVYSEIGRQVLDRGERAWDSRTIVSAPRKWAVMTSGTAKAMVRNFL